MAGTRSPFGALGKTTESEDEREVACVPGELCARIDGVSLWRFGGPAQRTLHVRLAPGYLPSIVFRLLHRFALPFR